MNEQVTVFQAAAADVDPARAIRFGAAALAFGAAAGARGGRALRQDFVHVVVQKGATFRQAHPDIPVLLDAGRYLAVDLDPAEADRLRQDESCWGLFRARAGDVVFAPAERPAAGTRLVEVSAVVEAVSPAVWSDGIAALTALHTRHSTSAGFRQALDWARAKLSPLDYAVTLQPVPMPGGETANLIAEKPGAEGGFLAFTAHLDSVNHDASATDAAPGADDNASGSAGVVALAHALAGRPLRRGLRMILFGGEEQGLFGSRAHVAGLENGGGLVAVVNMDMIACRNAGTPQPAVLLEGAPLSQPMMARLAAAAGTYTGLAVETSLHPFASDHVPFIERGIPAVLTIEGADTANTAIHSAADTPDRLDAALAVEILRMNAAFAAEQVF